MAPVVHRWPSLVVNVDTKTAKINGQILKFSELEFKYLEHLALCCGKMVTREFLHASIYVYKGKHKPDMRVVDVVVSKLRRELRRYGIKIYSIKYSGYCITDTVPEWTHVDSTIPCDVSLAAAA